MASRPPSTLPSAGAVSSADAAPTEQSHQVFNLLKQRSDEFVSKWDELVRSDVASFNQLVRQQDVQAIILDTSAASGATAAGGGERDEK